MQNERFGTRDLSYSAWHRAASIRRFVGWEQAQLLNMVDADCVLFLEYHESTKEPLALIEAAIDVGQDRKPGTAIARLARRACIPAYLVLYKQALEPNPADARMPDVSGFRIRRLYPRMETAWRTVAPREWAHALLRIRAWAAKRLDAGSTEYPRG